MFEAYQNKLKDLILPLGKFHPFPKLGEREAWEKLPADVRKQMVREGEKYLHFEWPIVPARLYMDFYRNGNRTRYTDRFNLRVAALSALVAAECVENKGRFIEDIINGVWARMDESTWVNSAHIGQAASGPVALPVVNEPKDIYVDMPSAASGARFAWLHYTMADRLDEEARQVDVRLMHELDRRIFTPFLQFDYFWWMGLEGQAINNWTPYCISHILSAAALACPDEEKRVAIFEKGLRCLENFVKIYAEDGGCDEGPSYWNLAGASFFDCLEILYDVTGGKIDFFASPFVRNMFAYIYRVHISERNYVNYADCRPQVCAPSVTIYRMSKLCGDETLRRMGVAVYHRLGDIQGDKSLGLGSYRGMKDLFAEAELREEKERKVSFPYIRENWFGGVQVLTARTKEKTTKGIFFSAKGGTNAESHNHNDIGSFILYANGKPGVIDVGTGVYEKKTFSDQRYEILQMQSQYHNVPTVNGCMQQPGLQFAAADVQYTPGEEKTALSMELKNAYPKESGLKSWNRAFCFDRKGNSVTVTDDFSFKRNVKPGNETVLNFMVPQKPRFQDNTAIVKLDDENTIFFTFDKALTPTCDKFVTEKDDTLRASWGKCVWRIRLHVPKDVQKGIYTTAITLL